MSKTQFVRHNEWQTTLDGLDIASADVHAYLAKCSTFEYRGVVYRKLPRPTPKHTAKDSPKDSPKT